VVEQDSNVHDSVELNAALSARFKLPRSTSDKVQSVIFRLFSPIDLTSTHMHSSLVNAALFLSLFSYLAIALIIAAQGGGSSWAALNPAGVPSLQDIFFVLLIIHYPLFIANAQIAHDKLTLALLIFATLTVGVFWWLFAPTFGDAITTFDRLNPQSYCRVVLTFFVAICHATFLFSTFDRIIATVRAWKSAGADAPSPSC
jgi:hypothetical protein